MKIGILTQPLHNNYGGLLQNYALQQVLINMGHTPITIDHKDINIPRWHVLLFNVKMNFFHFLAPGKFSQPHYLPTIEEDLIIRKNIIGFIDKYISHSEKCISEYDFIKVSQDEKIESFVVGSDQCWRPKYNNHLNDMYLSFARSLPVKKKIAYAASFGTDLWEYTEKQTIEFAKLLRLFDLVTVREYSAVNLCKTHFGVNAIHVLDPTMLILKKDYISIIKSENVPVSGGNLFNYLLDPTSKKIELVNRVAEENNMKPFQVLPKYNQDHRTRSDVKKRIEECIYPSPMVWLRAFYDAEMTIVDSFHGMVFSIIFNKPFWVIGNNGRGLSRFISLLSDLNLEDRMLLNTEEITNVDFNKPIDWNKVNKIVIQKRNYSLGLLSKSLN